MRKSAALLCVLLTIGWLFIPGPHPAKAAIAWVQAPTPTKVFSGDPRTLAYGSNVTAGNLLGGCLLWDGAITISSVSDTRTNTYTLILTGTTGSGFNLECWYVCSNASTGANTVSVDLSAAPTTSYLAIFEISGHATSSCLDVTDTKAQANPGTGTNAITTDSMTLTATGLVVGMLVDVGGSGAPVAGTGFTQSASAADVLLEYKSAAAGATTCTGTDATAFTNFLNVCLSFKELAAASSRARAIIID